MRQLFRVNYLEAALFPLRRPDRLLAAVLFWLRPQLIAALLAGLGVAGLTALGLLWGTSRTDWVLSTRETLAHFLGIPLQASVVLAVLLSLVGSLTWLGYWLRVMGTCGGGAERLVTTDRKWLLLRRGLLVCVVYLLAAAPVLMAGWLGLQLSSKAYVTARICTSSVGSTLLGFCSSALGCTTLLLICCLSVVTSMLANLALLRLAVGTSLLRALTPGGILRDLRQGWPDYMLCTALAAAIALLSAALTLFGCTLNVLLVPVLWLVLTPLQVYAALFQAALLGSYHKANLAQQPPAPPLPDLRRRSGCVFVLAGGACLALAVSSVALTALACWWDPDLLPSTRIAPLWRDTRRPKAQTPSVYAEIDRHALAAPASVEKDVKTLARYLAGGPCRSDRDKARSIYRWITDRISYDAPALFSRDPARHPDPSPENALRTRLVVCDGYSNLFCALAKEAGLQAEDLCGDTKDLDFSNANLADSKHAWSAVQLDGKWHLVDATWGAGHVNDKQQYIADFNDFYFLTPPEQLIYSHFPDEPRWQLLTEPIGRGTFDSYPQVRGGFFDAGLQLVGKVPANINAAAPFTIQLRGPEHLRVSGRLGDSPDDSSVLVSRNGNLFTVEVSPTQPGDSVLHIFAADTSQVCGYSVLELQVHSEKQHAALPKTSNLFQQQQVELISPRQGELASGQTARFELRIPGASEAFVESGGGHRIPLTRQGDRFSGSAMVAGGEARVFGLFGRQNSVYEGVLSYQVR